MGCEVAKETAKALEVEEVGVRLVQGCEEGKRLVAEEGLGGEGRSGREERLVAHQSYNRISVVVLLGRPRMDLTRGG